MNNLERFTIEGVTYYQEYRKCGKANCRVCRNGRGHGPYWYSRDLLGRRRYVGRLLPEGVAGARRAYREMFGAMVERREQLRRELEALGSLIEAEPLSDGEREILKQLGFGAALVPTA